MHVTRGQQITSSQHRLVATTNCQLGSAKHRNVPNDLQHRDAKGNSCYAVSLILDLLPESFLVAINKLLKLCLHELSQVGLTLLHTSI